MGVNLTPIIKKRTLKLDDLRGRSFAVDGNNVLYQFLALIRLPNGEPLTSQSGRVTSHLVGLLFRTTRLICDYQMSLIFVFDGKPPARKQQEVEVRRAAREKAAKEYVEALEKGDLPRAWSKAVRSSRVTGGIIEDSKRLLELLGIPWVQAPSEGEAQAAHMCQTGDVWASSTRDYDALLYGSPRVLRYLTIAGREFLPSKGTSRPLQPELIDLSDLLNALRLTREQLVDLAILIGTDYNEGIRGIGPRRALSLLQSHRLLEDFPAELRDRLPPGLDELRALFLHPSVDQDYEVHASRFDPEGVLTFLCGELDFSPARVRKALERLKKAASLPRLDEFGKT